MQDLKRLAQRWRRAEKALNDARRELAAALLEAEESGVPQRDVVAQTGVNRETIRLMVRRARRDREEA